MGTAVILVIHVFLAVGIVGLVLIQRGKGAEAGAGFGSGASGTVFGARGSATVLSKATAILATLFFVTSLALAYMAGHTTRAPTSLLEESLTAPVVAPKIVAPKAAPPPVPATAPDLQSAPAPAVPAPTSPGTTPPPASGEQPK